MACADGGKYEQRKTRICGEKTGICCQSKRKFGSRDRNYLGISDVKGVRADPLRYGACIGETYRKALVTVFRAAGGRCVRGKF